MRHLVSVFVFSNNNMQYPSPSFQVFGALHDKLKMESAYYPENYAGVCCTEVVRCQWSKFMALYCLGSMLNHISVQGLCVTSVDEKSVSEPALYLNIVLTTDECVGDVTTPFVTLRYLPHERITIDNLMEHIVVVPMLCDPHLFRGNLFAKSPLCHAVFPAFFRDAKHAQTLHIGFSATSNMAASFAHSSVKDGFFQFTDAEFPRACVDARDALFSHMNRPSFMAQVRALTGRLVHGPPRMRVLRVMPNGRMCARRCLTSESVHMMVFLATFEKGGAKPAACASRGDALPSLAFYHARHEMTIGNVEPMHNRGVLFCGDPDIYYGIPLHAGSMPMHILHMVWGEEDVENPRDDDEECITLNMRSENIHYV